MPVFNVAELEATMPDPEAVRTAAKDLLSGATAVDSVAEAAAQTWGKLQAQGVYVIDGAEVVFSAHRPITTASGDLAADFGTLDKAANVYADEVEALKTRLADAKSRAAWVNTQAANDEDWRKDEDLVNEQNSVMSELNSIAADLSNAERIFANALNAVHGGPEYVEASEAGPGEGQVEYGYSRDSLNAAAMEGNVPWGHPQEYDKPWYQDVGDAISSFGKGVWSGVTGTITGLGNMVGFGGSEAFAQTWKGLGSLATDLAVVAVPGVSAVLVATGNGQRVRDAGSNLLAVGKAAIHWDEWKTDPAYAAGASSFDLASILLTAGAGATAKVGSVASKVSDVASAGGKAGRAVEVSGLGKAASVTVKITDVAEKLKIDTARLATNIGSNILGGGRVDLGRVGQLNPEPQAVRSGVPAAAAPDQQPYRAGSPAAAAVPEPPTNRASTPAAAAPPEPPARRGVPAAAAAVPEPSNNRAGAPAAAGVSDPPPNRGGAPAAAAADAAPPRKPEADTQPARNDADDTDGNDANDVDETVRPETEERVLVNVGAEPSHAGTAAVPDGVRVADTNAGTDSRGVAHTADAPPSDRVETGNGSGAAPGVTAVDSVDSKPAAAGHTQAEAGAPANQVPDHGSPAAHVDLDDSLAHTERPDDVQAGAPDRGDAPEGGETGRGADDAGSDSGVPDGDPAKPVVTYDAQGRAETVEYTVGNTRTTHVVSTRHDQIAQLRRSLDPENWTDADGLLRTHLSPEDYRRLDDLRNPDGTLPPKVAEAQVAELVENLFGTQGRGDAPDGLSPLEGALRGVQSRYYYDLSDAQATLVHDIRHMLGTGDTSQPFQKIYNGDQGSSMLDGTNPYKDSVGGFVSQAADTAKLRTVDEIILGLRLDYSNGKGDIAFRVGEVDEIYAVRFHADAKEAAKLIEIPDASNHARVEGLRRDRATEADRWAAGNRTQRDIELLHEDSVQFERDLKTDGSRDGREPILGDSAQWPNTGHGLTSSRVDHTPIVPELKITGGVKMKGGEEMWRIDRNGNEVLVGIYNLDHRKWINL